MTFPRRIQMQKWWPAEHAIYDALQVVEGMGADIALTDAVILLGKAKDRVADFVDAQPIDERGLCKSCGVNPQIGIHRFDCPNHPAQTPR